MRIPLLLLTALTLAAPLAAQSVPSTLNYQGRLTDNTPAQGPVNAFMPMRFALWDAASGGTQLWSETDAGGASVLVVNGIFNVMLGGNGTPLPPALFTGATSTRYLEITLNPGAGNEEILGPRQRIAATGYAARAQASGNADNATTVTDGVYTTGSYADPAWVTSLAGAKISGTVPSATVAGSATNFSGALAGDVTGTQGATVVAQVGGKTAAQIATSVNDTQAATTAATPNTLVKRDGSGAIPARTTLRSPTTPRARCRSLTAAERKPRRTRPGWSAATRLPRRAPWAPSPTITSTWSPTAWCADG